MCGRFFLDVDVVVIKTHFKVVGDIHFTPRYNIAPSQYVPIIHQGQTGRQISLMHWGLVPYWSKQSQIKYSTINARAETIDKKPVYRVPFRRSRCLVPASGFYEWQRVAGGKQPYLIKHKTGLMAFAGVWDHWQGDSESINSFSIIVTDANNKVMPIHDRMPVILDEKDYDYWLDPDAKNETLKQLLVPYSGDAIELQRVSKYVNNPDNDDPRCIEVFTE